MNHLLRYTKESEVLQETQPTEVILEGDIQEDAIGVQEAADRVEQAEQDIRIGNDAVNSLYVLADAVETGVSDGASVAVNAPVVEVALEQIYSTLGMTKPASLSMEAGFTDNAKEFAGKIKDHAVRIMAAIIEAFRKAMDWISDFISEVTNASTRLSKYARQVEAEVAKVSSRKATPGNVSKQIDNKPLAKALSEGKDLAKRVDNLTSLVDDAVRVANGEHITLLNTIIDDFANSKDKDTDAMLKLALRIPDVLEKTYSNVFTHTNELVDVNKAFAPEGTTGYTTDWLPGEYLGILVLPDSLAALRHLKFVIRRDTDEDAGGSSLPTLSLKEMKQLLDSVIAICDSVSRFRAIHGKLADFSKKLTKSVDVLKKAPRELSQGDRELLGAIAIMAPYVAKGIHGRVFGFAVSNCRDVVKYCVKSLEQYDQKTTAA